jgi:hypothetical protein
MSETGGLVHLTTRPFFVDRETGYNVGPYPLQGIQHGRIAKTAAVHHIKEEKDIADAFAALVKTHFLDMMQVFVSSIPMGEQWVQEIYRALRRCKLGIVIASPESITSG